MQALFYQKAILRLSPQTILHSSYGLCQPILRAGWEPAWQLPVC